MKTNVNDLLNEIVVLPKSIKTDNNKIKMIKFCGKFKWSDIQEVIANVKSQTGFDDWRVPTADELRLIRDRREYLRNASNKQLPMANDKWVGLCWSQSPTKHDGEVLAIGISTGVEYSTYTKSDYYIYGLRLVR